MKTPEFNFPEPETKKGGRSCVFCGGTKLIEGAKLVERDLGNVNSVQVAKDRDPNAVVFRDRKRSETIAKVCGTCGYVHLFATQPRELDF